MSSNREPGVKYYASAIKTFLNEPTEVYVVQREINGDWLIAVPTATGKDSADSVTVVQWRAGVGGEEMMTAVRYAHIAAGDLRLQAAKPRNWAGRDFAEDIPATALVNHIPVSMDRRLEPAPKSDGSGAREVDQDAENTARDAKLSGQDAMSQKSDWQKMLDAVGEIVGPLARRVEKMEKHNGVDLFGESSEFGGMSPAEALAKARELAGMPPNIGVRPPRRPTEELDVEQEPGFGGERKSNLEAVLERLLLSKREEAEDFSTGVTSVGGVKGIQKMHQLRARAISDPGRRYKHVKHEAKEHKRHAGNDALQEYFESSEVTREKFSMYLTTIFLELLRAAEREEHARVKDLGCTGLLFLEQWHLTGNMDLAWAITLMKDPPLVRANSRKPAVAAALSKGERRKGRDRFSALLETDVIAAALAEGKNYADLAKIEEGGQ